MDVNIKEQDNISIVELVGDLDGKTAPQVQEQILPLAQPNSRILMDMSRVPYMSSAGLRMLLLLYRQIDSMDGHVVLVGVSEALQDTMSITGFLNFFTLRENFRDGLDALMSA